MTPDTRTTPPEAPWNESNPDWWQAQVEERGEYAWPWLVNEWKDQDTSFRQMQRALMTLDEEWPDVVGGVPILPENANDVPWPVRNFVRRIREALTR